jgi:hypothetical protein
MPSDRRVTILLTDTEYNEVRQAAGIASVSAYIKSRLFDGRGEDKAVQRVGDGSVGLGGIAASERLADAGKPKSAKTEFDEMVAGRTRHPVGCGCFQCVQVGRFIREQRKEK